MRDYKEPKNTKKYEIVEIVDQGDLWYVIRCIYTTKRFKFFGSIVEKTSLLAHPCGFGYKVTARFQSLDEAQRELNAFNTNSIKVVKEIEKRNYDC